jgi:hypothetical protein
MLLSGLQSLALGPLIMLSSTNEVAEFHKSVGKIVIV